MNKIRFTAQFAEETRKDMMQNKNNILPSFSQNLFKVCVQSFLENSANLVHVLLHVIHSISIICSRNAHNLVQSFYITDYIQKTGYSCLCWDTCHAKRSHQCLGWWSNKKVKRIKSITPFVCFLFCFYFLQGETIYRGQHQIVNMRSNALKLIVLT